MQGNIYDTKYGYMVRYGRKISKRFKALKDAEDFLTGIRFKDREGSLDLRDYQSDNPLGFDKLAEKFLARKNIRYTQWFRPALKAWGCRNIKTITYADIEDLLDTLEHLSSKTRYDMVAALKTFWRRLVKRSEISFDQMPDFPDVKYSMKLRKVIDKDTQNRILDWIYEHTWKDNPRIYIGVLFLSTYINVRPNELRNIKEKDIDLKNGRILIARPKEKRPKFLWLLKDDVRLCYSIPKGFPEVYFFRHIKGNGGAKPGQQFGKDYLYRWWKKACANIGVEGVPLYPGTRHSSAISLRKQSSPESIKRAMGTRSNKAFERYLQVTGDELRDIYARGRGKVVRMEQKWKKKIS